MQHERGVKRLARACVNTRDGLWRAIRTEEAVRTEALVLLIAIVAAPLVARSLLTGVLLVAVVALVLVVELLNTALEKLADRVQPEFDPVIGYVKDLGSAAVGVSILIGLAVWGAAIVGRMAG